MNRKVYQSFFLTLAFMVILFQGFVYFEMVRKCLELSFSWRLLLSSVCAVPLLCLYTLIVLSCFLSGVVHVFKAVPEGYLNLKRERQDLEDQSLRFWNMLLGFVGCLFQILIFAAFGEELVRQISPFPKYSGNSLVLVMPLTTTLFMYAVNKTIKLYLCELHAAYYAALPPKMYGGSYKAHHSFRPRQEDQYSGPLTTNTASQLRKRPSHPRSPMAQ